MKIGLWAALVVCVVAGRVEASGKGLVTQLDDAELVDVTFVDDEFGWAVGDRGVIWHTQDGGQTWKRQLSDVACRLNGVCFLGRQQGWAVGGWTNPYTHHTTGIVLHTQDGGRHWTLRSSKELPTVRSIKFFDDRNGMALGEPSPMYPTGVAYTDNGGKNWKALPGKSSSGWLSGDFLDPLTGVISGRSGELAVVRRRTLDNSRTPPVGLRGATCVRLSGELEGWMVGEGGLVLQTRDLGTSWQLPNSRLPDAAFRGFDFHALAVRGSHCWIAGSPGSRVLYTPDNGKSWQWFETGHHTPILAMSFIDTERGWAVGALGAILATADGGRTWTRQRSGGTRAAVLAVYAAAEDVPLELFAKLSGNDGYLGVAHLVARRDTLGRPKQEANLPDRFHEAMAALGACRGQSNWQFPMPPAGLGWKPEQVIEAWDQANDGHSLERLQAALVMQIRAWRPDVVVTYSATPHHVQPLSHLLNQAVLSAVDRAADATWYPEQKLEAGLSTWRVRKVLGSLPEDVLGDVNLDCAQLGVRLGRSLSDYAAIPRGLLQADVTAGRNAWGFHVLQDRVPQAGIRADLLSGIHLHPGGEARRDLPEVSQENLAAQMKQAQRKRNLETIMARSDQAPQGAAALVGQMGDLVRGMDETLAGQLLFNLARQHFEQGSSDLAADTMELLVQQYPDHPLSGKAMIWLIQYWSSGEFAWRMQTRQKINTGSGTFKIDSAVRPASGAEPNAVMNLRQGTQLAVDDQALTNRTQKAEQMGKWMERLMPVLFDEPLVRFPLAASHRRSGLPRQAERYYLHVRQTRDQDAWWSCADGERWLEKPEGDAPKSLWRCAKAAGKPRLDGDLSDPLWQAVRPISMSSPLRNDSAWPAKCWLAYDEEFLYLAVSCRRAPGFTYNPALAGPRPRDPKLDNEDRVHLCIDLDRDWATYFHLVIDHRGWVAEDCWGDVSWNPNWYVASQSTDDVWTAECAIPIAELTGQRPGTNAVWSVGAQRTIPGVGFQSWTMPASPQIRPEGFGYLLFE